MAGTVFAEFHIAQAHKIVAGTVICEVWHCPQNFNVECSGIFWNHIFGSCLLASAPLCFVFHGLWCFVDFVGSAILSEHFLSLDLT